MKRDSFSSSALFLITNDDTSGAVDHNNSVNSVGKLMAARTVIAKCISLHSTLFCYYLMTAARRSRQAAIATMVTRWQNLIPSFPWIAPGWRAWGAIQGKEGIKFCSAA